MAKATGTNPPNASAPLPKWPWAPETRQADPVDGGATEDALPAGTALGLFRTPDEMFDFAQVLCAGIPDHLDIKIYTDGRNTTRSAAKVSVTARGTKKTQISRTFEVDFKGRLVARHDVFILEDAEHGGGNANRMMRACLHAYDRLGVKRITTEATLKGGGYTWARCGFVPDGTAEANSLRDQVRAAKGFPSFPGPVQAEIHRLLALPDDEFPRELAMYRGTAPDEAWGKLVLLGTSWSGYIDLTDPAHRARVAQAVA